MRPLRFGTVALVLLAVVLALSACGGGVASLKGDDVAVVGSQHITQQQFAALMERAKAAYKAQKRTFPAPGTPEYQALKNQAVEVLVQRAEFEQKASDVGVKVDEKKVDDRIGQVRKQYFGGSDTKFKAQLAKQGLSVDEFRQDERIQILSQDLYTKITKDVKVSDNDAKKWYDTHKSQYGTPETREIRHILVPSKALANKLFDRLKAGESFAKLARKYSKDPSSARNGGKLTVSKGLTVPTFDQTAFLLGTGTISRPIKTQYGYHLIQPLSEVKPAKTTPFNQVKASIKQQLLQQKKNEKMQKWVDDTKKEFKKKIRYADGYKPPSTSTTSTSTTG
jgi:foldase protein PrsA